MMYMISAEVSVNQFPDCSIYQTYADLWLVHFYDIHPDTHIIRKTILYRS